MKFIRTFWGDVTSMNGKYLKQILRAKEDNLNEKVYVWGKNNFNLISKFGFDCTLISEEPYDYTIANNHPLYSYGSLIHKLKCIDIAIKDFGEIIFVDWDCRKIKELDDNFYKLLSNGFELKVPLYAYPKYALDWLIESSKNENTNPFFCKLKEFVMEYSYQLNENFIIPNTGFIYCRDSKITERLFEIAKEYKLETVPDEFAVFLYAKENNINLDRYISLLEPLIIGGKEQNHKWWQEEEEKFNQYKDNLINKEIYFIHK